MAKKAAAAAAVEVETIQEAEPARGRGRVVYYGYLRNREQVIYEDVRHNVGHDDIMYALSQIGDGSLGFLLPPKAGRRKGWGYHRVEYFWWYDVSHDEHRQWQLVVD